MFERFQNQQQPNRFKRLETRDKEGVESVRAFEALRIDFICLAMPIAGSCLLRTAHRVLAELHGADERVDVATIVVDTQYLL